MEWYGVQLIHSPGAAAGGYGDSKQWSVFISAEGHVIRNWSKLKAGVGGGQIQSEGPFGSALDGFKMIQSTMESKTKASTSATHDRYTGRYAAVRFTVPDDKSNYDCIVAYHVAASGTSPDANPVQAMFDLIQGVAAAPEVSSAKKPAAKPAAAPAKVALLKGDRFHLRPNGEKYFTRTITGHDDVLLLRSFREHGIHTLIAGPPGCGKTALIEAAFPDCYKVDGGPTIDGDILKGGYQPTSEAGKYVWKDGPLTKAALEGKTLFIDEIARIVSDELTVLYPAMDGSGFIHVEGRPEELGGSTIKVAEGFTVVGAYNPLVPGAYIDAPLRSRFGPKIEYWTDFDLAASFGVPRQAITAAKKINELLQSGTSALTWAPQMRELLKFKEHLELYGEEFAISAMLSECPADERSDVLKQLTLSFAIPDITPLVVGKRP